jgi:hypothetical protein
MANDAAVMVAGRIVHMEHASTGQINADAFTTRYRALVASGGA